MFSSIKEGIIVGIGFWFIGALVAAGAYLMLGQTTDVSFPAVPQAAWQSVFLENGQVYFGKLSNISDEYVALSNVYYLKEASDLQGANLNLVKLGGELHGPEDVMYIRKDSISFWENMKPTSRVVQSIEGARQ